MKLSIITINYNNSRGLLRTIESIINQSYLDFEYIIIDGGSTDGSIDVINEYASKITYWISEPDKGIYDAMNKGLEKAKGEWVSFMNSGDTYYNLSIISEIFNEDKTSDVIYGDNVLVYKWGSIVLAPDSLVNILHHMVLGHQTAFVRRTVLDLFKFDCNYKVSADYKLFYLLYKHEYKFEYIPKSISICDATDGVSKTNPITTFKEDAIITDRINHPFWKYKFICFIIRIKLRFILLKILPKNYVIKKKIKNTLKSKLVKQKSLNNSIKDYLILN